MLSTPAGSQHGKNRRQVLPACTIPVMTEETDSNVDTYAPPAVRRAATIRKLAQGEGLTPDAVAALEHHELGDFSVTEPEQLYDLLKFTAQLMQYNDPKAGAIKAALGLTGTYKKTLTERRWSYLEEDQVDMSLRTLMRYEQEGAELMAQQVEVALTMPTPNATWQNAAFSEMKSLKNEVNDLKHVVAMLIGLVSKDYPGILYTGRSQELDAVADAFGTSLDEFADKLRTLYNTQKNWSPRPATESESDQD